MAPGGIRVWQRTCSNPYSLCVSCGFFPLSRLANNSWPHGTLADAENQQKKKRVQQRQLQRTVVCLWVCKQDDFVYGRINGKRASRKEKKKERMRCVMYDQAFGWLERAGANWTRRQEAHKRKRKNSQEQWNMHKEGRMQAGLWPVTKTRCRGHRLGAIKIPTCRCFVVLF